MEMISALRRLTNAVHKDIDSTHWSGELCEALDDADKVLGIDCIRPENNKPKGWREDLPEPPVDFDPSKPEQVEALLKTYNVEISRDDNERYPGWGVLYKGGGGIMCPFLQGDKDGQRARAVIAFSVYLHLKGVNVALCDRIAYWYIQGPVLNPK